MAPFSALSPQQQNNPPLQEGSQSDCGGPSQDPSNYLTLINWRFAVRDQQEAVAGEQSPPLFPDFSIILIGIRKDNGQPWSSSNVTDVIDSRVIRTATRVYKLSGPLAQADCGFRERFQWPKWLIMEFTDGFPLGTWRDLIIAYVCSCTAPSVLDGRIVETPETAAEILQKMRARYPERFAIGEAEKVVEESDGQLDVGGDNQNKPTDQKKQKVVGGETHNQWTGPKITELSGSQISSNSQADSQQKPTSSKASATAVAPKPMSNLKQILAEVATPIAAGGSKRNDKANQTSTLTSPETENDDDVERQDKSNSQSGIINKDSTTNKKRSSGEKGNGTAMEKTSLDRTISEHIVYDVDGNPVRVEGPDVTPELAKVCSALKLKEPEGAKQDPPLANAARRRSDSSVVDLRRESRRLRPLVDYADQDSDPDSYFRRLDRVQLDSEDEEELAEIKENLSKKAQTKRVSRSSKGAGKVVETRSSSAAAKNEGSSQNNSCSFFDSPKTFVFTTPEYFKQRKEWAKQEREEKKKAKQAQKKRAVFEEEEKDDEEEQDQQKKKPKGKGQANMKDDTIHEKKKLAAKDSKTPRTKAVDAQLQLPSPVIAISPTPFIGRRRNPAPTEQDTLYKRARRIIVSTTDDEEENNIQQISMNPPQQSNPGRSGSSSLLTLPPNGGGDSSEEEERRVDERFHAAPKPRTLCLPLHVLQNEPRQLQQQQENNNTDLQEDEDGGEDVIFLSEKRTLPKPKVIVRGVRDHRSGRKIFDLNPPNGRRRKPQ